MALSRNALGGLLVCAFSVGTADAASLDAKPGLWERSVTTQTELTPTAKHDLSKLAPDERAKLEQAMSGQVSTGRRTRVSQECVTQGMLERWSALAPHDHRKSTCKRKVASETSKHIKVALSCDGGKTTGDIEFTASGERIKGSVAMVSHEPAFDRVVTQQITSKWLGSDCGGVTPLKP